MKAYKLFNSLFVVNEAEAEDEFGDEYEFEAEAEATEPRALAPWNRDIPQLQHQRILPSDRPTASILA